VLGGVRGPLQATLMAVAFFHTQRFLSLKHSLSLSDPSKTAHPITIPFPPPNKQRWIGPVAFDRADVDYVGIKLEVVRSGAGAGTVGGITYFDAEQGYAQFIRASKLVPNGAAGCGGGNGSSPAGANGAGGAQ